MWWYGVSSSCARWTPSTRWQYRKVSTLISESTSSQLIPPGTMGRINSLNSRRREFLQFNACLSITEICSSKFHSWGRRLSGNIKSWSTVPIGEHLPPTETLVSVFVRMTNIRCLIVEWISTKPAVWQRTSYIGASLPNRAMLKYSSTHAKG